MGRRGNLLLGLVTAIAVLAAPVSAAAPVKPRNGLYQGATAQYEAIGFQVISRDSVDRFYFGLRAGTCDSFASFFSDPEPISNRGRFTFVRDFGDEAYTIRGRFLDKETARGRLIHTIGGDSPCGVNEVKVRFRVKRSTPPR